MPGVVVCIDVAGGAPSFGAVAAVGFAVVLTAGLGVAVDGG
jgi:hypothetical protein